ncbi:6-phosphofructokinase [Candidatus Bipolaricaulota bacterium]|nr:6-phosphofructokinase [Candidatus Bipolaricaulota bacterium]
MARIGVLTSGGDAPGMNAAIRSVVRCGTHRGFNMFGIDRGYAGLIDGDMVALDNRAVGGIIERGGTMLRTARSQEFRTSDGQQRALTAIRDHALDGLIVIGGNGSLRGAQWLSEHGVPTVGIPASIDNDIPGSSMAIGVDSALNTVVECLDRIRDTAISHQRAFVVEVMGRESGYIALMGGLAGGAEIILLPELPVSLADIARSVRDGNSLGKRHSILVVAEGFRPSDTLPHLGSSARAICNHLDALGDVESRLTILGHLQRGGSPTAFDRILASRFGEAAIQSFASVAPSAMMSYDGQGIVPIPFTALDEPCTNVNPNILKLADIVAH